MTMSLFRFTPSLRVASLFSFFCCAILCTSYVVTRANLETGLQGKQNTQAPLERTKHNKHEREPEETERGHEEDRREREQGRRREGKSEGGGAEIERERERERSYNKGDVAMK